MGLSNAEEMMYEQLAQSKETASLLHPASSEEDQDESRPAGAPSVYQSLPQPADGVLPAPHKQLLEEDRDDPAFVAMEMEEMDADNLPSQAVHFRGLNMPNGINGHNGSQSAGALQVLKNAPEPNRVHNPPPAITVTDQ